MATARPGTARDRVVGPPRVAVEACRAGTLPIIDRGPDTIVISDGDHTTGRVAAQDPLPDETTPMPHRIRIATADDKSRATIEITAEDGAGPLISFTEDQLLAFIRSLGHVHQEMVKGREVPPLIGQRTEVVTDTRWAVGTEQLGEATVMSFQHPAFGPVSFMIPIDQAERIAQRMLLQVRSARESRAVAN